MPKIVVGVDGSAESVEALRWAIDEARLRPGTEVVALYAWTYPRPAMLPHAAPPPTPADLMREARTALDKAIAEAGGAAGVDVRHQIVESPPVPALLAEGADAVLLVAGARGLGGFKGLMLGSVSQQVATHAPCPVVIIPKRD